MPNSEVKTRIKPNLKIAEPQMYRVLYLNDDVTSMSFVLESLITFFDYTHETAETITIDIHEKGSAVVAILPYEIAEQKGTEVTYEARKQGFPLKIKIESQE
jgi:ATP-dependent Clp protease adaptor protein ClpS